MINKDSIVTAYDEHLTLVEWLQKVSKALNESVLTNLGIAKLSEQGNIATYQVTATFADNTTIVSDTFDLPSVDIVEAFNELTNLVTTFDNRITTNKNNIINNTNNISSIMNIINIAHNQINAGTLQNSINGSDDVIVDIDDTNDKLEIHLSAELQAKLARVLLLPLSAPNTRKVVTIDTNGAQENVDGTEIITLMNNIVDSHGNKRFQEFDLGHQTIEGVTFLYGKMSLSGTHLMLVTSIEVDANTNIAGDNYGYIPLAGNIAFMASKIVTVGAQSRIRTNTFNVYDGNGTPIDTIRVALNKESGNLVIRPNENKTYAFKVYTTFQFDLLIDSE